MLDSRHSMSKNKMSDKAFLTWLKDRLIIVYHESPNADFIIRLDEIIESLSAEVPYGDKP